jgi:hypothetical protein
MAPERAPRAAGSKRERPMGRSTKAKKNQDSEVQGITRLTVRGYKSLAEERSVEIRPLTILAGANSSGKSSIVQPLLLLKQTLDATYDPGALLINAENVRFAEAAQLLSKLPARPAADELLVGVEIDGTTALTDVFRHSEKQGFELSGMTHTVGDSSTTLSPDMTHEQILRQIPEELDALRKDFARRRRGAKWAVVRDRCFLALTLRGRSVAKSGVWPSIIAPTWKAEEHIREAIHLPGHRGDPARTYKTTALGPRFAGTFEPYAASLIFDWQEAKSERLADVATALTTLGLTWKVRARRIDDTQVELLVGRLPHSTRGGAADLVSIADVGFGLSQVLPVVVALVAAKPNQFVFLEQPEIHLHPKAQVGLARLLVDAANRGVRVVAETHSALLLLALQTSVAAERIRPELVTLHWFRRRDDGVTEVTTADLDAAGAFGDWPEDFSRVELAAEDEYLSTVEARQGIG